MDWASKEFQDIIAKLNVGRKPSLRQSRWLVNQFTGAMQGLIARDKGLEEMKVTNNELRLELAELRDMS